MGASCSELTKAPKSSAEVNGMAKTIAVTGFRSEAAKSGARKLRGELTRAMADLKRFRKLLKPLFSTPGDAFDDLSEGRESIDRAGFMHRAGELGFTGDAGRLFDLFSDAEGHISNRAFRQRMTTAGRTNRVSKDGDFAEVVDLAVRAIGLPPDDAAKAALAAEQVLKRANSRRSAEAGSEDQKPKRSRSRTVVADKHPSRSRSRGSLGRSSSSLGEGGRATSKDKKRSSADTGSKDRK